MGALICNVMLVVILLFIFIAKAVKNNTVVSTDKSEEEAVKWNKYESCHGP